MSIALQYCAFGACVVAWSIALWSIMRAMRLGRRASCHLTPAESNDYLRNLLLFPTGLWVEGLLKSEGHEAHLAAAAHVQRAHKSMLAFAAIAAASVPAAIVSARLTGRW
jgi:hypothetical protein